MAFEVVEPGNPLYQPLYEYWVIDGRPRECKFKGKAYMAMDAGKRFKEIAPRTMDNTYGTLSSVRGRK